MLKNYYYFQIKIISYFYPNLYKKKIIKKSFENGKP